LWVYLEFTYKCSSRTATRYLVSFMLNEIKQKKRGKRRKSEGTRKSDFTFDAIGCIVCQDPKRNWIRVRVVACINRDERKKGRRDKEYEGAAVKGRKTERNVADKIDFDRLRKHGRGRLVSFSLPSFLSVSLSSYWRKDSLTILVSQKICFHAASSYRMYLGQYRRQIIFNLKFLRLCRKITKDLAECTRPLRYRKIIVLYRVLKRTIQYLYST